MRKMMTLASVLFAGHAALAVGGEAITDAQWGETRCDLVAAEHRDPCMAAHDRLGIPPDKTAVAATTAATPASGDEPEIAEITRAKRLVTDQMKDPASVMFSDVVFFKEKQTVCGSVNAKNSYGGYGGYKLFIVDSDGKVTTAESKYAGLSTIRRGCTPGPWPPIFGDNPKEVQDRADVIGEVEGEMPADVQEEALAWIELNQASTDRDVVRAAAALCDMMNNRGSKSYAGRLADIENNAADKKVRSECRSARKKVERRD